GAPSTYSDAARRRPGSRRRLKKGGERFGGLTQRLGALGTRVPQIVVVRRGPQRAHLSMGERGPQKYGREMGCMGVEDRSIHLQPPPSTTTLSRPSRAAAA